MRMLMPLIFLLPRILVAADSAVPLVIAHRGASGYLPEHTLEAKVLAVAQGADYVEQDLVMTADDALIVFHDLTLDRMTDVATRFPGRARADGLHYVIDFSLEEIRTLQVGENQYPGRFPAGESRFGIHTLQEELELLAGLQRSSGSAVGIYPELKSPWFHHQHGKDLAIAALQVLKRYGYDAPGDAVFVQSFDHAELVRVHDELMPALGIDLPLVQLIAENAWDETYERGDDGGWTRYDYDWMHTPEGLRQLAGTVAGVGPAYAMLVDVQGDVARPNGFVAAAHEAGLVVHPFTFRSDVLPPYAATFDALLRLFTEVAGVDGVFTDFPDKALYFLQNTRAAAP